MERLISIGKALTPRNVLLTVITHNMITRPAITLSNKNIPENTRRYTASREFCTELFGLINTLTFTTFVEWLGPRLANREVTAKMIDHVKVNDWNKLAQKEQHLKAIILMSSLIGSAMSCGILTPLLNNLVLNQVLDKILNRNISPKRSTSSITQRRLMPTYTKSMAATTPMVQPIPTFSRIG
jgi:hypothetical protein